jgi:O-antigen/teichoic acid export membrane protein
VATLFAVMNAAIDFGGNLIGAREMSRAPERASGVLGALLVQKALFALGGFAIALLVLRGAGESLAFSAATALAVFVFVLSPFEVVFQVRLEAELPVAIHSIERLAYVAILFALAASDAITMPRGVFFLVVTMAVGWIAVAVAGRRRLAPARPAPPLRAFVAMQTPQGVASLAAAAYFYLDTFYLRFFRGAEDVATYAAAYRIYAFGVLIPGMTMQAIFPVLSALAHRPEDRDRFAATYRDVLGKFLVLGLASLAAAPMLSAGVVATLFPRGDYAGSVVPLVWLAAALAMEVVGSLASHAVVALGGQAIWMRTTLAALAINAAGNLVAIPFFGPSGAAAMTFATEAFVAIACVANVRSLSGAAPRLRDARPAIAIGLGAGAGSLAAIPLGFAAGIGGAALGAAAGAVVARLAR